MRQSFVIQEIPETSGCVALVDKTFAARYNFRVPISESTSVKRWFCAGDDLFPAMLAEIDAARSSICLEIYIYADGTLGQNFRDALIRARDREVRVRVLVDAIGSFELPRDFWSPLDRAGGEIRWFNPVALKRVWIRNHRKMLVCDERVAFVGGFNIAPEYEGDGIARGWRDLGIQIEGPLAGQLAESFHDMFNRAEFRHRHFARLRKAANRLFTAGAGEQLLLSGPGRGPNPVKRALRADFAKARDVRIIAAYFLPTWRLRRDLMRVVRRGGRVQLILAGKSDVLLALLAGRSLYRRLLKNGVEIYEYQPQVLHAKLVVADNAVYAGSANLDQRSLEINYELMIRYYNADAAAAAAKIFEEILQHCRRIESDSWSKSRSLWERLKQRLACWLLLRFDPWVARRQWRSLGK